MVAKSFQDMEIVKEPYKVNGRMYVMVKNSKTGKERQVRWYTEAEYNKMYPETPVATDHSNDPYWKPQKVVLGFGNGFITIFKDAQSYEHKEWYKSIGAVYRRLWGWGLASDIEVPEDLPEGVEPVRLDWSMVGSDETEKLLSDEVVQKAVDSLLCEPSNSEYQGEIGDRLVKELTVVKAIPLDGFYGASTMHIMEDADENVYVWTTGAKQWAEGTVHQVRGTVKDHKDYKNTKQTILTRCTEVKK